MRSIFSLVGSVMLTAYNAGKEFVRSTSAKVATGIGVLLGAAGYAQATDPPAFELADTGVDVGEAITTTIVAIGAVILVALGGWFAFRLIRRALGWARKAF